MHPGLMPLTIGAMLLGGVLLYFCIGGVLRLLRESEVVALPAAAQQQVTFQEPGSYVLHQRQPRLNTALMRAQFALRDAGGNDVPSSAIIFRTRTSGFSTASISVRSFEVPRAGAYTLIVTGIKADADLSRVELVFTRPYAGQLVLWILGIVLGGVCTIGGLVFTSLLYAGKL